MASDQGAGGGPPSHRSTDVVPDAGAAHVFIEGFRIVIVQGPGAGTERPSDTDRFTVGSHPSATLPLEDAAVSRFHCELRAAHGRVVLRDLDSRNGTRIDGVQVIEAVLHDGAIITVGQTTLRFETGREPVGIALSSRERFGSLVGRSAAMRAVFRVLEQVAATNATVLLRGESGTGKEVTAESLHQESDRANGPFVVVDCGAIPPNLLEAELFGHERGAFTGAVEARLGAFEAARGGTLFLDEIGELGPDLQPKLLRALDRRQVKRVGATRHIEIDVRIIAATNRNLRREVNAKRFRSDLYYRLAVVEIELPPLRERPEEIPALVEVLIEQLGAGERDNAARLRSPAFLASLERQPWPGNVRELRNFLERSLVLGPGKLPEAPVARIEGTLKESRDKHVRAFERRYLEAALEATGGNVSEAARVAGVDRIHFYRLLWRCGLK